MHVPYIPDATLEADAYHTLREVGAYDAFPVDPVEVAMNLGLTVEHANLAQVYGNPLFDDVLGSINIPERLVFIQELLLDAVDAGQPGRYNFTVAHECGHWVLHRGFYLSSQKQLALPFDTTPQETTILCRDTNKDRKEHQADRFAPFLLMPRHHVEDVWRETFGRLAAVQEFNPSAACKGLDAAMRQCDTFFGSGRVVFGSARPIASEAPGLAMLQTEAVRYLAMRFEVSQQAMAYRLEGLGLIPKVARAA